MKIETLDKDLNIVGEKVLDLGFDPSQCRDLNREEMALFFQKFETTPPKELLMICVSIAMLIPTIDTTGAALALIASRGSLWVELSERVDKIFKEHGLEGVQEVLAELTDFETSVDGVYN